MRWLIHGNVTPAAVEAMKRHEQKALSAADAQIAPDALFEDLLRGASKAQLEVLTTDSALVDAIFESGLPLAAELHLRWLRHCSVLIPVQTTID